MIKLNYSEKLIALRELVYLLDDNHKIKDIIKYNMKLIEKTEL